ncbi:SsgA family sporulation/cell division regulator [Streptomyces sp. NPDC050085]|uniref:SsgA family sporulation/cell division regulator n=1 Tax=Streptomyces sp. NPDC050085 TaxID=3365600 RepID=UPI0037B7B082
MQVRLTFCGTDPVAVQAVFQIQGKETSWTFGRDLLVEGIRSKVGDGDVSVWPETPEVGDARLYLELRPPEGRCVVSLPRPQVKEFLEQAMHIVPRSAEERYVRSGLTELEMHLNQAGTFSGRKDS